MLKSREEVSLQASKGAGIDRLNKLGRWVEVLFKIEFAESTSTTSKEEQVERPGGCSASHTLYTDT